MRKMVLAVVIIAAIMLLGIASTDACGDKALRIGRGVRFQRPSHPAAVLIYIPSNTTRATQLQSMLKKVGHKSYAAQGADRLSEALRSGQYDIVLVDLAEAAGVEKQIGTSSSKPVVITVVPNGTKAEVAAAQKQYRNVVKNPHSADQYLDAIEAAMRSRVRLLAKKA
jgi:DNA-binding NtrC family response regulator